MLTEEDLVLGVLGLNCDTLKHLKANEVKIFDERVLCLLCFSTLLMLVSTQLAKYVFKQC